MPKYDLIVVPALRLGPHWGLRRDLKKRLLRAVEMYKKGDAQHIIVLGRWTVWFDWLGVRPPVTESVRMKQFLVSHGVARQDVITEQHSKDTIGNAYYLKLYLQKRPQYKKLVVICAKQHEQRVRFLFEKFLGSSYALTYIPMTASKFGRDSTGTEAKLLREQRQLLKNVRPGHVEDFSHQLYNSKYYRDQARAAEAAAE